MKINDVEKQLGITKANIRFYEKEGLITPLRSQNGYREYSEADIAQLKEIIILRKLGIPVQQIADIQDGALPLQEALDSNIAALQAEIEKLNGSLALCRQLQAEDARMLDTERYWEIINEKEEQGMKFKSLINDYLNFMESTYQWLLWYIPAEDLFTPKQVIKYMLFFSAFFAGFNTLFGGNFWEEFELELIQKIFAILFWSLLFIPLFFLSKKYPKLSNKLKTVLIITVAFFVFIFWLIAILGILRNSYYR